MDAFSNPDKMLFDGKKSMLVNFVLEFYQDMVNGKIKFFVLNKRGKFVKSSPPDHCAKS